MNSLKLSSCMGDHTDAFCRAVADHLGDELSITVEYVNDIPWQERERLFDAGLIQICWICGWPYVMKADAAASDIELLGVPVPSGERYLNRAIYFSDIVVRRDSPFNSFADLRGARWAYNEPRSHSGYNLVRWHLSSLDLADRYFNQVVESGAHRLSLQMILEGQVDGVAIDSMVLEWETAQRPEIRASLRIVETLGPSPIPPWVVSKSLSGDLRAALREALLNMHKTEKGRAALALGRVGRFLAAEDGDYNPIRAMARMASEISL
jgi:phosphonate transport system substrate-binding protein